jgi:GNAT superfamily N-acetyltransferase
MSVEGQFHQLSPKEPRMADVVIRPPQAGDGADLARVHLEACRYYHHLDPDAFQVPATDGLADWFEAWARRDPKPDHLRLVAAVKGTVVATITAHLERPHPEADKQLPRDLGRVRLHIDALAVGESARRSGVATRLMQTAEDWGRDHGAAVALLDTYAASPLSVPFYEQRMGYSRHAVIFRKHLA